MTGAAPGGPSPFASSADGRLLRLASVASMATAALLLTVKLGAWLATDSVALLSSTIDSLIDLGASGITFLAVRQALVPADHEHRFGHGKAEPLAALAQAGLICGSGLFVVTEAVGKLISPAPLEHSVLGMWVMVFALLATFMLTRLQLYVVRKTGSVAVEADSLHYLSDFLLNGGVLAALLVERLTGWGLVDPLAGLAVAGWLLFNAWKIGASAYDHLMDHELPEEERREIRDLVLAHPDVRGLHDMRTRSDGKRRFIQLHLEMDGAMTLYRAHAVAETIEAELQTRFPDADVIVHEDIPVAADETPHYHSRTTEGVF